MISRDTYLLQAKRRIKDPQVGKLLERIYELEQIITTNSGQFRIFYKRWIGAELPDTIELEEINRLKLEIIKNLTLKMSNCIEKGEFNDEKYNGGE